MKNKLHTKVTAWMLTLVILSGLCMAMPNEYFTVSAASGIEITPYFIDANFLAAVREKLGKLTGAIFDTDVETIKELNESE